MKNKIKTRETEIVIQDLESEILIYDLKINKAFCLNESAAIVWRLCDGRKTIAAISQEMSEKLKTPISEDLVWLTIDQLKRENLLVNSESVEGKFEGLSRRQIIKKIGFASMIALPVIASVTAPTAVNAASQCVSPGLAMGCSPSGNNQNLSPDGCPCGSNIDCQGVCLTSMFCVGGPPVSPYCAPGNSTNLSATCCPCNSNNECIGVCILQTMTCS